MNKSEMIDRIAADSGQTKSTVTRIVDQFLVLAREQVSGGGKVELHGFGSFEPQDRAAREGRNPRTGEKIAIAAKRTAKFNPAKPFLEALNAA